MSCQAAASNPNASNLASRLLNFVAISASVLFQRAQKAREHTDQRLNEFAGVLDQIVEKLNETMQ
jgi:hypothetical protein